MKVCVTGGTGFVGSAVVTTLLSEGFEVHALARSNSIVKLPNHPNIEVHAGEALDLAAVQKALSGCDALVHLVGGRRAKMKESGLSYNEIDVESARIAVEAMQSESIKRIILLSAGAIGNSEYVQCKAKAEKLVRDAELDWTILRPSFILGTGQQWPRIMTPMLWLSGFVPGHFGEVAKLAQNITRDELAKTISYSLKHRESVKEIYDVPAIRQLRRSKVI